ncbi:MAG: hypothetical protein U0T84_04770 [Chitinophagales bacterium]
MKKGFYSLLAVSAAALMLSSCGDKYTPLTEEQKAAKADSMYNASMADMRKQKEEACAAEMEAKVNAKVQEMLAAEAGTAEAEKK